MATATRPALRDRLSPRARRLAGPLSVGALVVAATVYLGAVDPNEAGHYPLCPTKALTGLDCPGCGGLRAVHSLAHGDLVGALDHNALVVLLVLPVAVIAWARWLRRSWRGEQRSQAVAGPGPWWSRREVVYGVLGLVVAFTVARNIGSVPAFAWLGSTIS